MEVNKGQARRSSLKPINSNQEKPDSALGIMIGKAERIQGIGNKHVGGTKGDKTTKKICNLGSQYWPQDQKSKWAIVITAENC